MVLSKIKSSFIFSKISDFKDHTHWSFLIDSNAVLQAILFKNHYENIEYNNHFVENAKFGPSILKLYVSCNGL